MPEVKAIRLFCPKCNRLLLQMSFINIILAPHAPLVSLCTECGIGVSLALGFPDLFHPATREELLQTTVPYETQAHKIEG